MIGNSWTQPAIVAIIATGIAKADDLVGATGLSEVPTLDEWFTTIKVLVWVCLGAGALIALINQFLTLDEKLSSWRTRHRRDKR